MDSGRQYLISVLVIPLLVVGLFLLFNAYQDMQGRILNAFTAKRMDIAGSDLQGKRQEIEATYGYLFKDCDDRQAYDAYIDTDSRSMTASELREALRLHAECGNFFAYKNNLTLGFFKTDIDALSELVTTLPSSRNKNNAAKIALLWESIYTLEKEHNDIYNRMVRIQEEYWNAELNKVLGLDSADVREEKVSALNYEANQKLARIDEIVKELKTLREKENTLWQNTFAKKAVSKAEQ